MSDGKRKGGTTKKRPGKRGPDGQEPGAASLEPAGEAAATLRAAVSAGLTSPELMGEAASVDPLAGFFVGDDERQGVAQSYLGDALQAAAGLHREMTELLSVWVADEEYAVDILEIQEIIKVPLITEVPRTDPAVLGIISLRGTIVPVLDLRRVLRMEERPHTRATRILVLRGDGDPLGLLVDRVTSVVRIERDSIEPVPRAMVAETGDLLKGVGRVGDRLLIVLELPAVLALMEKDE